MKNTGVTASDLLLENYETLENLDFAIAEFRNMKMQPSLESALRYKNILKV